MGVLSDVTYYLLITDKGACDAGVFNMSLDRVLIVFRVIDKTITLAFLAIPKAKVRPAAPLPMIRQSVV